MKLILQHNDYGVWQISHTTDIWTLSDNKQLWNEALLNIIQFFDREMANITFIQEW